MNQAASHPHQGAPGSPFKTPCTCSPKSLVSRTTWLPFQDLMHQQPQELGPKEHLTPLLRPPASAAPETRPQGAPGSPFETPCTRSPRDLASKIPMPHLHMPGVYYKQGLIHLAVNTYLAHLTQLGHSTQDLPVVPWLQDKWVLDLISLGARGSNAPHKHPNPM